jgi:hypothetical protein
MDNDDWKLTTDRFVAFFDIMGFKDLVLKSSHEDILDKLNKLSKTRMELDQVNNATSDPEKDPIGITKSFTFSDSIFIFSKTDSVPDVTKLILDCNYILKEAFKFQIPIKGAISFGKITVNRADSIYFGQPIIDAFLLHEELNLYSVISDHNFEKRIQELSPKLFGDFFIKYKVPLKSGRTYHYMLMPLEQYRSKKILDLEKLYTTVSGKPRQYIDNTIEFIEGCK